MGKINSEKRLQQFWGEVDKKHIKSIVPFIKGKNVLDLGCGNGSTTAYITKVFPGIHCIGMDGSEDEIRKARVLFPGCDFRVGNAEAITLNEPKKFDTIILRDALHHLYEEADFDKVKYEIDRISHKNTVLIVLDPNINYIVKLSRYLIAHQDAECQCDEAIREISQMGFVIVQQKFTTLYSLPLSGGYVGYNFVPDNQLLYAIILGSEYYLENIVNLFGLGRFFCWRYLIVANKS